MKFDKLYNKYINLICKKFYLLSIIYLFLHLLFIYIDVNISHFIFIFKLENLNYIELIFYVILNFLCIFISQYIISKILIKNIFLIIFTLIFIIPLYLSIILLFLDVITFDILFIYDNKNIIINYIFNYI